MSRTKLARPELFRLIADSRPDDVLLIEQVDRLLRLTAAYWQKLRADLDAKQIHVVALDLPTSWMLAGPADDRGQTSREARRHRPQRRDFFDAARRFVMDGDSGRLRMQPGDDRQGRKRAAPASHGALTNCSTLPSILRVSLFAQDRRRSEPVACNDRRLIRACGPSREGKLYLHTLSGRGQLEITRIGHGPRAA